MARPEVTGRKLPAAADEADAFSVAEFCKRHRISPQLFYKFKAAQRERASKTEAQPP
jgi:hypothetical protein